MSQRLSRRDLVRVFTRHMIDEPDQRHTWVMRLAAYITVNGLGHQVDLIVNDIAHELEVQAGLATVEVVSARQLSDEMRQSLRELLRKETGVDKILLHETTDQSLLGGFVARTADAEIDASVRSKLKKLSSLA